MLMSIGKAARILGVSISTLRLWERQGKLRPSKRTLGNHRRYTRSDLESSSSGEDDQDHRLTVGYCRVSSSDQREDLVRQEATLLEWKEQHNPRNFLLISDLGSGLNFKKRGIKKLLSLLLAGNIRKIVLCHQDRLLRFGNELVFILCEHYGVEVELIQEKEPDTAEIKLAKDVITLITVFTSRLYALRGHEKRRARLAIVHG